MRPTDEGHDDDQPDQIQDLGQEPGWRPSDDPKEGDDPSEPDPKEGNDPNDAVGP